MINYKIQKYSFFLLKMENIKKIIIFAYRNGLLKIRNFIFSKRKTSQKNKLIYILNKRK